MHSGCFVWTPTPRLAGRRTPTPGPVRVCMSLSVLAGSGGPPSRALSGASNLFLWPLCLFALLGPLRAGVAPLLVLCLPPPPPCAFFFFSVVVFRAPPLSLAFFGFRPWVPRALALCVVFYVGAPCAPTSFVCPALPLAARWWLLPRPHLLCLAFFVDAARCLW